MEMSSGRSRRWKDRVRHRWQRFRSGSRAIVLAYHRIAKPASDPFDLCVSPETFRQHLEILQQYRPVRLDALLPMLRARRPRGELVCVTFDDGYADNLHTAMPLLRRYGVPATVFVIAGAIGRPEGFWWDRLARLDTNGLEYGGRRESGSLQDLRRRLETSSLEERRRLIERLDAELEDAELEPDSTRAEDLPDPAGDAGRPLEPDELNELASDRLIEIGAHTMTHPGLDQLSARELPGEIGASRTWLEDAVGGEVSSFAFPYGRYSASTLAVVEASGFTRACTSRVGVAGSDVDPLQIPRMVVTDWDAGRLERCLAHWFGTAPPRGAGSRVHRFGT